MIVFACRKCKYTDVSDAGKYCTCPRCGGSMAELTDTASWNELNDSARENLICTVYENPAGSAETAVGETAEPAESADDLQSEYLQPASEENGQETREPSGRGIIDQVYASQTEAESVARPAVKHVKKSHIMEDSPSDNKRASGIKIAALIVGISAACIAFLLLRYPGTGHESYNTLIESKNGQAAVMEAAPKEESTEDAKETVYDLEGCLYYQAMPDEERAVYEALYDLVMHKDEPGYEREVTMEEYEFAKIKDNFKFIYMAMLEDHPEFFYLQSDAVRYPEVEEYSRNSTTHIRLSLTPGRSDENEMIAKFERAADDFMKNIDITAPENEIELQIHDKLIDYVSYDREILNQMITEDLAHTAYGALVEDSRGLRHKAVCDGYAYAFQYLLSKAGIQSAVVVGKADFGGEDPLDEVYHAWNIVKLDGQWYETDCCWDDFELQKSIRDVYVLKEIEKNEEKYYLTTHHWFNRTTSQMKNLAASERTRFFITGYESFNIIEDSTHIRGMKPESDGYELHEYLNSHLPEAFGTEYGL